MKIAQLNADVLGLKIWYADGSIIKIPFYELWEGWAKTPSENVQVISIYDRLKRSEGYYAQWFAGHEYYAMTNRELTETNRPKEVPEGAVVKFGSLLDKDAFLALYNNAMKDREF